MGFWAIIPVKPLRRGKSRLSSVLNENERTALNECLLQNTLAVLSSTTQIDHTLVISRDPQALTLARKFHAQTLLEQANSNLNRALEIATAIIRRPAHRGLLILPADLPLIDPADIQHLLAAAQKPPVVVIAPDRHDHGTNALLVSPPGLIRYSFGIGSFQRHCEAIHQAGARLEVVRCQTFALDLDIPEDLDLVRTELNSQLDAGLINAAETYLTEQSEPPMLEHKQRCLDLIPIRKGVSNVGI